jgi:hypothetical protein
MSTAVVPAKLATVTPPEADTGTVTRLATVSLATKLTFDVGELGAAPCG